MKYLLLLLFTFGVYAQQDWLVKNTNGFGDTSRIANTLDSATYRYSKTFNLSDAENISVLMKVDDTAQTGFAKDSFNFEWGYQVGTITYNSSGTRDTAWTLPNLVVVDTVLLDSLGKGNRAICGTDMTITQYWRTVDTSSVSGYAIQDRPICPYWHEVYRFWARGLGGVNRDNYVLRLIFEPHRRQYSNVRTK